MYNVRMRCEGGERGGAGSYRGLLEANPANSTLATDLDVFLFTIQRKEEKEMKFWEERQGITLLMITARLLECLKCARFFLASPEAKNKNQKYGSVSKQTELNLLNQTRAPRRESFTTQFLPGKNLQSEQPGCLKSLKIISNIKMFSMNIRV